MGHMQRAQDFRIGLPDVRECYRACLSIFSEVLAERADAEVQRRWNDAVMRSRGSRAQSWAALKMLQDHAKGELEFLVTRFP